MRKQGDPSEVGRAIVAAIVNVLVVLTLIGLVNIGAPVTAAGGP